MKPEELMIGDWVEVTQTECVADGGHYITWSEYGKVIGITDSYIEVEVRDGEYNVDAHEDELKPIPLTPEILEKNGFIKQAYDGWLISENNGRGLIEYRTDCFDGLLRINYNKKPFSKLMIKVKYVHKLQHALKLCGIDKEIEI